MAEHQVLTPRDVEAHEHHVRMDRSRPLEREVTRPDELGRMTGLEQQAAQPPADGGIVVRNQDGHACLGV